MKLKGLFFPDNLMSIFGYVRFNPQPKRKRIALKRNSAEWKRLVMKVFIRDGFKCYNCKNTFAYEFLSPCHIKSVGSGGDDVAENLRTGCKFCHHKEHNGEFFK